MTVFTRNDNFDMFEVYFFHLPKQIRRSKGSIFILVLKIDCNCKIHNRTYSYVSNGKDQELSTSTMRDDRMIQRILHSIISQWGCR